MTISRGQMERQLRMGGGIMDVVPREPALLGGIKKAVKKVGKTVKKIAKSDLGKAALLYAGTAGLGALGAGSAARATTGFGGIFNPTNVFKNLAASGANIAGFFKPTEFGTADMDIMKGPSRATSFLKKTFDTVKGTGNVGKIATLGLVSTFLTKTLGMPPEQAEAELARDPSGYLEKYYRNLNPNASEEEIQTFVTTNTSEYAVGGRVGFADGPVLPPDTTQPVNPFGPKPGDFGIEEDIPIKTASYGYNEAMSDTYDSYLEMKKKGLIPPTMDFNEFLQEVVPEMSGKKIKETRGVAALGGRMGFDEGSPKGIENLMSLTDETIDIPMEDAQGAPSILDKFDEDDIVIIIETGLDGKPKLVPMRKSELMPGMAGGDSLPIVAPRNNKAKGDSASMNAMQAAGIEGLPIRQNQAGVKELDLRNTGGFIQPVGIKEKEDDIPAMLSNNEFVFTADAVRGMGDGDVNLGAQRMYDQMKMLEAGGKV